MKMHLQPHWKLFPVLNIIFGTALWLGFFTDFSLRGTIPDILFPPFVAIFALITVSFLPVEKKKLGIFVSFPSLVGGCLYLLMGFVMLAPPFTLAFLFGASEVVNEVRIQRAASPNNTRLAEVYFRPVGAYSGGSGRIYVRVAYNYFPILERDIYYLRVSHADENTMNYVRWSDNNTLYISETNEQLSIGKVKPVLPTIAMVPLIFVRFVQYQARENRLTTPLNDIPIYSAKRENESTSYWDNKDTSERIYFLPQANIKEVYDWHLINLSKHPWEIIDSHTVLNTDPAYKGYNVYVYCINALNHNGNQTTTYYFEITELHKLIEPDYSFIDPNSWDIRVIVATPNPVSIHC